jgi:hypothetical protein
MMQLFNDSLSSMIYKSTVFIALLAYRTDDPVMNERKQEKRKKEAQNNRFLLLSCYAKFGTASHCYF